MKVSKRTILRTAALVLALINQILSASGFDALPFFDEEIYGVVSTLITALCALWAWWKNNSFTLGAIEADEYMERMKNGGKNL